MSGPAIPLGVLLTARAALQSAAKVGEAPLDSERLAAAMQAANAFGQLSYYIEQHVSTVNVEVCHVQ